MAEKERSPQDEQTIRMFVENFSAILADAGMPRMAARVMVAELVAEEDSLTAADLAEKLGVSPAAISNGLKYLTHVGLFVRESVPNSRRDRYRMNDASWYTASFLKSGRMIRLADEADKAIEPVGGLGSPAGAKLGELRDFFRFVSEELTLSLEKWERIRGENRSRESH